jgi:GntR family transcriptional regulator, transcriptional repressor for pyruvate dehydrogenase complex
MSMETKPLHSDTLANTVADQILEDILTSDLQAGDLFMTGDQVRERYAVSRSVAREAVSRIQALGVLECRQRKGLLVARPDPVQLTKQWLPFYCRKSDLDDLLTLAQLRYALEAGAVDLAVSHASEEQVETLAQRAAAFAAIAGKFGPNVEADQADLAFHKVILEMTGNILIAGMYRVISDYFHASTQLPLLTDASKAIREHQVIVEAFRRRDNETVRAVMRAHLETTLHT